MAEVEFSWKTNFEFRILGTVPTKFFWYYQNTKRKILLVAFLVQVFVFISNFVKFRKIAKTEIYFLDSSGCFSASMAVLIAYVPKHKILHFFQKPKLFFRKKYVGENAIFSKSYILK